MKGGKIEENFQFKVTFSHITITIQRIRIESKRKKKLKGYYDFFS